MKDERVVVLVRSESDYTPTYATTYWPNFVAAVTAALRKAKIECRVVTEIRADVDIISRD